MAPLDRRPSQSGGPLGGLYGPLFRQEAQEAISKQEALSVTRPLWPGSPLSQVSMDNRVSQLGGISGHEALSGDLSGLEALSVRRPLWTGGPLSQEVSMDRRLSHPGGLWTRGPLSQDRRPSLSRMPPKSGGLSGQEAHSVRALLWTGGSLSQQASRDRRPS